MPKPPQFANPNQLRSAGKKALIGILLNELKEGQVLTYNQVKQRTKLDPKDPADYGAIKSARDHVAKNNHIITHVERGKGIKRSEPDEVPSLIDEKAKRTHRALNRTKALCNIALTPRYYDRMSPDEKKELFRKASALGALSVAAALNKPLPGTSLKIVRATDRPIHLPQVPP